MTESAGGTPANVAPSANAGSDLGSAVTRTHHLLMLEFGDRKDFDDPRLEWRRLFSELLGTFMLVLVAAGGGILHGSFRSASRQPWSPPGLMVLAIILFMGAISGAHLNPAVRSRSRCAETSPGARPRLIIVQLSAPRWLRVPHAVFGISNTSASDSARPGVCELAGLLMEIVLTRSGERDSGYRVGAQNVGAIARWASAATSLLPACGRRR